MELFFFSIPPDIPVPLDNLQRLRSAYGQLLASNSVGLVELDLVELDGLPAVKLIIKVPQEPLGMTYAGSFTIPRRDFSYVKIQCIEYGTTGTRDSIVLNETLAHGLVSLDQQGRLLGWFAAPYDPTIQGSVMRNQSDDEVYDQQFLEHPLSRLRSYLKTLESNVSIEATINQVDMFLGLV